jgi:hypothetical protein
MSTCFGGCFELDREALPIGNYLDHNFPQHPGSDQVSYLLGVFPCQQGNCRKSSISRKLLLRDPYIDPHYPGLSIGIEHAWHTMNDMLATPSHPTILGSYDRVLSAPLIWRTDKASAPLHL